MNKKLILGAVGGCAALAAVATAKNRQQGPKPTMWDKMREGMEEMPEDFPPRIMFDNVEATRANTEHILDLLHAHRWSEDIDDAMKTEDTVDDMDVQILQAT